MLGTMSPGRPPRFLLYSHDGVGFGHVRRNLHVAAALVRARPDASVLLATGVEGLDMLPADAPVDVLRLPGIRKVDNDSYVSRRLALPAREVRSLRSGLLLAAVQRYRPDVIVADKHPGGASGELVDALSFHRATGGRAAVGLRDVLDAPERAGEEWRRADAAHCILALHDLVLVYGQAELFDPLRGCVVPDAVRRRVRYCGYVRGPEEPAQPVRRGCRGGDRPVVLATAGGGEDGGALLGAFIGAARLAGWDARAVTGPQLDAGERARLEREATRSGVLLTASVAGLGRWVQQADAVVCMGGYNSLVEVLAAGVPAVCVPRARPRTEQLIRARILAERGLVTVVEPERLTPDRLRLAVDEALAIDRGALAARTHTTMDLGGATRAAAALIELAATPGLVSDGRRELRKESA